MVEAALTEGACEATNRLTKKEVLYLFGVGGD
jgi:hypothetical protein